MTSSQDFHDRVGYDPESSYHEEHPLNSAIDPRLFESSFMDLDLGPDSEDARFQDVNATSMTLGQRRLLQEQIDLSESDGSEDEDEDDDELWDDEDDGNDNQSASGADSDSQEEDDDIDASGGDGEDANEYHSPRPHKRRRRGQGPFSGPHGARGGKGIKRGPRRPLEPSPEFKLLHSQATEAFIDGDYDRAIGLVKRAIQINPEMFAAHSLLSEILLAQGEKDKAVAALWNGAHTRPRDPTVWYKVAKLIQERAGDDRQKTLDSMIHCYSRIIEIDPKSYNARFQRAAAYRELGHNGKAAGEYERILKELPHNIRALRHLAETYIDMHNVQKAIEYYIAAIEYYMSVDTDESMEFSWSDVNICAELFAYINDSAKGLQLLSSVSRWLLGRKDDYIWDDVDDDREWDAADIPRRIKTDGFIPDIYAIDSYGLGLPMELRIKLGTFRLKLGDRYFDEALAHFEWLNPDETAENSSVFDYADLYREAADAIKDAGLFAQALRFYKPLQLTEDYADVGFFLAMGDSAFACADYDLAESSYLMVVENDPSNLQSRVNLAKLYEEIGEREQALNYVNQAVLLGREAAGGHSRRRRKDRRIAQLASEFRGEIHGSSRNIVPRQLANIQARREAIPENEAERPQHVQYLYSKMIELRSDMRTGDVDATEDWLDIADALLHDFRSNRAFYPLQKNMMFHGYSREEQKSRKKGSVMDEMQEMAGRLQEWLGQYNEDEVSDSIPNDYYGISFDEWYEIFLEYAFVVSGQGDSSEAYDVLAAAADASVWYHSKDKVRQIHICWITCALRVHDEETLVSEARWFAKEYQFVTDTYRLFSMLSRVCGDPSRSLFHASPSMKFMLRQVKSMDWTLPEDHHLLTKSSSSAAMTTRNTSKPKTASLTSRDENGDLIPAEDMDVALLVLYGNILYSGNSFYPALNYYFRAYALDSENPAILLSIALCYVHHALKRQAENRHYLILQGLSFMSLYRKVREKGGKHITSKDSHMNAAEPEKEEKRKSLIVERQEVEFNFGRFYHSLGLLHQAVPCYERALELGDQIRCESSKGTIADEINIKDDKRREDEVKETIREEEKFQEDFSPEAAVALQNIYALSGNTAGARRITEKYLII